MRYEDVVIGRRAREQGSLPSSQPSTRDWGRGTGGEGKGPWSFAPSPRKGLISTIVAGLAGGVTLNLSMLLTFRLVGFGWEGGGILLDPARQSAKLIEVWTRLEPLPLVVARPAPIIAGLMLFGVGHALIYRWLAPQWPPGVFPRGLRLAGLLFFLSFLFWEFFTPFNQFGEPLSLIALELLFWSLIALAEGLVIASVFEFQRKTR